MSYLEMVIEDVTSYINDNINLEEYRGRRDDLEEELNDDLWIDDSVTGNGSGSYYFNSYKSREAVLDDMDTVQEALREFCIDAATIGEKFMNEEWEYLDVTARCYVLGQAIGEVLDNLENEGIFEEEEEEQEERAIA